MAALRGSFEHLSRCTRGRRPNRLPADTGTRRTFGREGSEPMLHAKKGVIYAFGKDDALGCAVGPCAGNCACACTDGEENRWSWKEEHSGGSELLRGTGGFRERRG